MESKFEPPADMPPFCVAMWQRFFDEVKARKQRDGLIIALLIANTAALIGAVIH